MPMRVHGVQDSTQHACDVLSGVSIIKKKHYKVHVVEYTTHTQSSANVEIRVRAVRGGVGCKP